MEILYIDDEKINLLVFKKIFEKKYSVTTAISGEDGLSILGSNPDIEHIVTDLRMPRMSGLEFIEEAQKLYPNKKYFILSGYSLTEEIQEAIDSGKVIQYFMKPANFEEIDTALQAAQ